MWSDIRLCTRVKHAPVAGDLSQRLKGRPMAIRIHRRYCQWVAVGLCGVEEARKEGRCVLDTSARISRMEELGINELNVFFVFHFLF